MTMRKWILCVVMLLSVTAWADGSGEWWNYYDPVENPDRPDEGILGGERDTPHEVNRERSSRERGGIELTVGAISDVASELHSRAGDATQTLQWWQSFRDGMEALNELDRALDRSIEDDGDGPRVPSSCIRQEGCHECFRDAYARVNFVRLTLERLRTIHSRTINFIEHWESFGDSVAPIHGMSGLAWQSSRAGIEQARKKFNETSMHKYEQLIGTMRAALEDVAVCEERHFDNPDWNSRYGFMYLQAVKTAYRPSE